MWLDATLAYLHFISIFLLFGFLTAEAMIIRNPLDAASIKLLGRVDMWFGASSVAVLVTGFARLAFGAKGGDFYLSSWPIYAKVALFLVVGLMSIYPTIAFIRWRKLLDQNASWRPAPEEQVKYRKLVMAEVHLAALIPVFAVIMSRGLGH